MFLTPDRSRRPGLVFERNTGPPHRQNLAGPIDITGQRVYTPPTFQKQITKRMSDDPPVNSKNHMRACPVLGAGGNLT